MFRQRVITALILAALLVLMVMGLSSSVWALFTGVVMLAGAWEWSRLSGLRGVSWRLGYLILMGVCAAVTWWSGEAGRPLLPAAVGGLWWGVALVLLALHQPGATYRCAALCLSGIFALAPAWYASVYLHQQNPALLLFLFLLVWVADIAAYLSGKRLGKTPLAHEISPGKTREGLLGALGMSVPFALLGAAWLGLPGILWVYFLFLCLLTVLMSVAGDLYESLLKRQAGVKDSGRLFPGHGGMLDRIDSLTSAAPIFLLGFTWVH